jgi:hypothetical protein
VAARLEARLSGGSLHTIGVEAAVLAQQSLTALVPVLGALGRTITLVCGEGPASPEKDAALPPPGAPARSCFISS